MANQQHEPRIGIILGTTRRGRFADRPGEWLLGIAQARRTAAAFEIVDLRDYPMPLFDELQAPAYGPPENQVAREWGAKMAGLDGYIFVMGEYNHSVPGVLKNALDYLYPELKRKPASFVAYGGVGGARGVEHLRNVLTELQATGIRHAVYIGLAELLGLLREGRDFGDYPHLATAANAMLDELLWWVTALKTARECG